MAKFRSCTALWITSELRVVVAKRTWIAESSCLGSIHQQEAQQGVALLADVPERLSEFATYAS
jgi:hypothetical protein